MINKVKTWLFGDPLKVLNDLPESKGNNKCRTCGSTTWKAANTDPNKHWLSADVIECSDCPHKPSVGPK